MSAILGTIFSFAIVFGILVFIHEFGHFFMAKLVKMRVEVFSWGYGKRLFGIKKGETDYRISLFPMGGYVKFSGDEVLDQKRELAPGDFMAKKRWERFLVMFMGSVMNIFLAVFLFAVINMAGVSVYQHLDEMPVIGWIEPSSPAEKADLMIDDEILSVNNRKTKTWGDVDLAIGTRPEKLINLEIKREEETLRVQLMTESKEVMTDTSTKYDMGYAGFFGKILTQVRMVSARSPAEKAGLQPGDVFLKINGEPVYYYKFGEIIEKNPKKEIELLIERGERILTLRVTPRLKGKIGEIGILREPKSVLKKFGVFTAVYQSFKETKRLAFLLIHFIKGLITGETSARHVGGPLEIANFSYAALRGGILSMMWFIAFVSLQLGIINLFPIPVFDGGHILVLGLEGLFRRDFGPKVKQIVMQIGFAIFIFLISFVILNDIAKRLPNGWESFLFWK